MAPAATEHENPNRPMALDERWLDEIHAHIRQELSGTHEVGELLGWGGMSLVYLAHERELGRDVALKVQPVEVAATERSVDRFRRETKIAASLDHLHIVPVYSVGVTPRAQWYAMKYVKGASLADILHRRGALPFDTCLDIVEQVASALDYAHRRGVIHRDIKPGNILLDEEGWVWVCDFGIARAFGSVPLTQTGLPIGTPGYMAPEQCYGRTLDGCADQYALGVVTYECLVGEPPFRAETYAEMIHKLCSTPPPDIAERCPSLPLHVADALRRVLEKEPTERHVDVVAFVEALGGAVQTRGPRTNLDRLVAEPDRQEARGRRRTRFQWVGWAALAVAVAGFAAVGLRTQVTVSPSQRSEMDVTDVTAAALDTPATPEPNAPPSERVPTPSAESAQTSSADVQPSAAPTEPNAGLAQLSVYSQPWGYLYLSDSLVGTTNVSSVSFPSGSYRLRVEREGFETFEMDVRLPPGEEVRLTNIALKELKP